MNYQPLGLSLILSASLVGSQPQQAFAEQAMTADAQIQHYERKYISFFYPQDFPLNAALARSFQQNFPRFDYHLASTALDLDLGKFLQAVRDDQAQRAGELAAGQENTSTRFGDKLVSWSETQKISQAAYVFVPHWTLGEISIDGPHPAASYDKEADWSFSAQSDVDLELDIFTLKGVNPKRYQRLNHSWTATRPNVLKVPASEVKAAAAEASTTDNVIDIEKSLSSSDREKVLKALRKRSNSLDRTLQKIENQNPYSYMMQDAVDDVGYNSVIEAVRRLSAFLIKAEVSEPDMQSDRISIQLAPGEDYQRLGIRTDASYKIFEYVEGQSRPREVGYLKVRERYPDHLVAQPIIVGRDFELGDQVIEYPKAGMGFNIRGGATFDPSLSGSNRPLGGGGGIDFDVNLGPVLNLSETYLSFSGGWYNGFGMGEIGLQKKWFMRQLIFSLGLRGGGAFSDPASSFGGTALAGLYWQASPDFAFGLEGGWRQYSLFSGALLEGVLRFDL